MKDSILVIPIVFIGLGIFLMGMLLGEKIGIATGNAAVNQQVHDGKVVIKEPPFEVEYSCKEVE